jgi:hypothetical protein
MLNFFANRPLARVFDSRRTDVNRNGVIDNADSQIILNFFADAQNLLPSD